MLIVLKLLLSSVCAWGNVHEFSDKTVHLKTGFDVPGYDLLFQGVGREVKFQPNVASLFSVGASIQDLVGFSWGFRTTQTEQEIAQKGKTDYQDWRFNFAFSQFVIALNYSQYTGFYIEKSQDVSPGWTSALPYVRSPNLSSRTAGANFTWVFSPKDFSLVAAYDQTARQEDSGGSWLLGAAVTETVFRDDVEIIPATARSAYGGDQNLTEGRFFAVNLKGGYGHTLVLSKKYFLSGAIQAGFGIQKMKLLGTGLDRDQISGANKADFLISLGWNGDDHFSGISLTGDGTIFNTGEFKVTSTLFLLKLFYGFRL